MKRQADCVCSMLASGAQVQRSKHKVTAHLSVHSTLICFFVSQEGEMRHQTETVVGGRETRFASTSFWCHILHLQSKESMQPGLPDCRPCHSNRSHCAVVSHAVSRARLHGATNLIGVLKMRRKEGFTAAAHSCQTAR